jgi:thiaminase/transcriptional activator TenA
MAGLFTRLKTDAADEWWAYTTHDFVRALGEGSLPPASFRHYLAQDYLFLIHFARAYALAAYKAPTLASMRKAAAAMTAILETELKLHVRLVERWGIDEQQLEATEEARETIAYTRFVLDAGARGDLLDLTTALAPCVIGYAEIGRVLAASASGRSRDNPYREWIAEYAGDAYQALAGEAEAELDRLAAESLTEARYPRLLSLFRRATRLEADFWQMGLAVAK